MSIDLSHNILSACSRPRATGFSSICIHISINPSFKCDFAGARVRSQSGITASHSTTPWLTIYPTTAVCIGSQLITTSAVPENKFRRQYFPNQVSKSSAQTIEYQSKFRAFFVTNDRPRKKQSMWEVNHHRHLNLLSTGVVCLLGSR